MRAYTQYYFDGGEYNFSAFVRDRFQLLAKKHGPGEWFYNTLQNGSEGAVNLHKSYTYILPAGTYDIHFNMNEATGDALSRLTPSAWALK